MIAIFGTGEVGQGVAKLLHTLGFSHEVLDDATRSEEVLEKAEKIVVSPGIPPHHRVWQMYRPKILSELSLVGLLFSRYGRWENFEIIGITGTNGKSTTTWVTYQAFSFLFKQKQKRQKTDEKNKAKTRVVATYPEVYITGNFKPSLSTTLVQILEKELIPTFSWKTNFFDKTGDEKVEVKGKYLLVIECSSFMLYRLEHFSFDYSILINITPDHLNWHSDMDDYIRAKWEIVKATKKASFIGYQERTKNGEKMKSEFTRQGFSFPPVFPFGPEYDLTGTRFIGEHNAANLQAVFLLIKQYCVDHELPFTDDAIRTCIAKTTPVPHRFAYMMSIDGIAVYDDGICTSSDAQKAALKSIFSIYSKELSKESSKVVLICGGSDKGDSFDHLDDLYRAVVGCAICLGTSMAPRFMQQFSRLGIPCVHVLTMKEAVQQAFLQAKKYNLKAILFSPGCASFDIFKNVYDRIEQFEKEIKRFARTVRKRTQKGST